GGGKWTSRRWLLFPAWTPARARVWAAAAGARASARLPASAGTPAAVPKSRVRKPRRWVSLLVVMRSPPVCSTPCVEREPLGCPESVQLYREARSAGRSFVGRAMARRPQAGEGLHRGEDEIRHFDEDGVPQAHRSVPESGMLVDRRGRAGDDLLRDQRAGRRPEAREVERRTVGVADRAGDVDRVEVARFLEQLPLVRVG